MTRRPRLDALVATAALVAGAAFAFGPLPAPWSSSQPVSDIPVSGSVIPGASAPLGATGTPAETRSGAPDSALPSGATRETGAKPTAGRTASGAPQLHSRKASPSPKESERPRVSAATTTPGPRPATQPVGKGAHSLQGTASWFCLTGRSACTRGYPASCLCAAASHRLQWAIGSGWRSSEVTVTAGNASVRVRLVDECQCYGVRLLDLYAYPFSGLATLSAGLIDVTVAWP